MLRIIRLCGVALLLSGALAAEAVAASPPCPSAAFTIAGIGQPEGPGTGAEIQLDLPGPGSVTIRPNDGGTETGGSAPAAGRMPFGLPTSAANGRKYSGGTQSEAGEAVTVGYTITFQARFGSMCTRPDGTEGFDASSTQATSYTFAPNPLKTVNFTFSSTAAGRFSGRLTCTGMPASVCGQHAFELDLALSESTYRRHVQILPDDNLLDIFGVASGGRATFKFSADTLRGMKRIKSVRATLGIRLQGVRGERAGLRTPQALEKTVTIRKGKIAKTTFTMTNVDLGGDEDGGRGRG